jgi:hypothetical protein
MLPQLVGVAVNQDPGRPGLHKLPDAAQHASRIGQVVMKHEAELQVVFQNMAQSRWYLHRLNPLIGTDAAAYRADPAAGDDHACQSEFQSQACKAVLELSPRLRENTDLAEYMADLKRQVNEMQHCRRGAPDPPQPDRSSPRACCGGLT